MSFPEKIAVPDEVLGIVRRLEEAGHETWCVGGAVRDAVLGQPHADFDIATAATPPDVQGLFRRTIPVGVEHGTVVVLDERSKPHEVTTFRRDVKTDGRHAEVVFGVSLEDDLARRDFTINAIAYHPFRETDSWRDPFEGVADIERKLVRAVGDARRRFKEDYLRILRAMRFTTRFGFQLDGETWSAAVAEAGGLANLSAERVRDEWFKSLNTAQEPAEVIRLWTEVGAWSMWMGGKGERGKVVADPRRLNELRPRDPVLMTSYLSTGAGRLLTRLRCSRKEIARAEAIDRFRGEVPAVHSLVAVRKWLAKMGPAADDLISIWAMEGADDTLRLAVEKIRAAGDALTMNDLAVTGEDLKKLGVAEGPLLGTTLRAMLDDVLENPCHNTRDYLMDLAGRTVR